ncbi:DNA-binding MarR family transcriptional regulator [Hydrogenispora ethanolica]|uniref:DNA-binding MarR family transcriptional regulator n=2 Tax=Hydrogenispora ethanolica TaxID=1082276 RepID=A0A4R1RGU6_HYDET|nr:DNA-binding MarR family transcriptional regulator [Hydrogenispora ethanolica]
MKIQLSEEAVPIQTLDNPILREIGMLSRIIHSKCDLKYREYQLQKGQFIFLTRICEHPGLNHIQLSNLLKVDKTTTTKAVQKLSGSGYVRKEKDASDSRAAKLYPTPRALTVYDLVIAVENAHTATCLQGFTPEEIRQAGALIERMRQNMESVWQELKRPKGADNE